MVTEAGTTEPQKMEDKATEKGTSNIRTEDGASEDGALQG